MGKRPKITIHKSAEGFYALQRVRSDEGRFWTKKMKLSDPAELAKAKPEEIWKTGDGRELLVKDMDTAILRTP